MGLSSNQPPERLYINVELLEKAIQQAYDTLALVDHQDGNFWKNENTELYELCIKHVIEVIKFLESIHQYAGVLEEKYIEIIDNILDRLANFHVRLLLKTNKEFKAAFGTPQTLLHAWPQDETEKDKK
ncbi:MAG: hypothetical protein LBC14_06260 [Desulfovibrio sp.]|jgi:hypothetical protein|nr:hypothetical protein [Desulfovibrio sp.]